MRQGTEIHRKFYLDVIIRIAFLYIEIVDHPNRNSFWESTCKATRNQCIAKRKLHMSRNIGQICKTVIPSVPYKRTTIIVFLKLAVDFYILIQHRNDHRKFLRYSFHNAHHTIFAYNSHVSMNSVA